MRDSQIFSFPLNGTWREAISNGERSIMYLEKVKARIEELQSRQVVGRLVPCSVEEVHVLEEQLGRTLPAVYREFLLLMGQRAGGLLGGTNWLYEDLNVIQEDAVELMQRDRFPVLLPPDTFVFLMHQRYQFGFFRLTEGDDPPVYFYMESDDEISLKISASHYSIFLFDIIEAEGKLLDENKRNRYPENDP